MISKKECIAMFPTLILIEIHQKRLDLMKNRVSFIYTPEIHWELPYQRVRNLHYQCTSVKSNKATRS